MACRKYATRYERLVANTRLAVEDDPQSCWLWTGYVQHNGYPRFAERVPGKPHPVNSQAHRAIMEELLDAVFPFDEVDHLCHNVACLNPTHLEVVTPVHNLANRRGKYALRLTEDDCLIPTLFPREDTMQEALDAIREGEGPTGGDPPF